MSLFQRKPSPDAVAPATEGPLSAWERDQEAIITAVTGTTRLAARLREIGVVPGMKLKLLRTGTRIVFQVGQSRYCLRQCDAETIRVCASKPYRARPHLH